MYLQAKNKVIMIIIIIIIYLKTKKATGKLGIDENAGLLLEQRNAVIFIMPRYLS